MYIHFRKSILHGDVNDYNLLIQDNQVSGIIDFGDITYGPIVFDLAIALSYLLPHQSNPSEFANAFIAAYHQQHPLEEKELESLYYLIALRCCQSILNAAYSIHKQPKNKVYINISQKDIWALLEKWITVNPIDFSNQLKTTCGFSIENVDLEVEQKKRDQLC